jgi:hypothetical protein
VLCGAFAPLTAFLFFKWRVAGIIHLLSGGGYRTRAQVKPPKTALPAARPPGITAPLRLSGADSGDFIVVKDITILPGEE